MSISVINKHKYRITLLIVILLGVFSYITGAGWGLPFNLHPDEHAIVETAIRITADNSLKPDVYMRPDHLLIIMNALVYRVMLLIKGIPLNEIYNLPGDMFYLTARIITGVFGAGSIIIGYLIGKKNSNFTGIMCAVLLAFFPTFTIHAHYATPDVPTVFFMLLFIYFAILYFQNPAYKNLVLMSLATALFITVKYPGAILCLMIAVTVIIRSIIQKYTPGSDLKCSDVLLEIVVRGIHAAALIGVFIFLISPALVQNYNDVWQAIVREASDTHLGSDGLGWRGNMLYYINDYWGTCSILMRLFFISGCFAIIIKIRKSYIFIPILYSIIYFICLSYLPLHHQRWGLPMYVTPLLVTAFGINMVYEAITGEKVRILISKMRIQVKPIIVLHKTIIGCFFFILCVLTLNLITSSYRQTVIFTVPDTRVVSKAYADENGINVDNTVYEGYSTFHPQGRWDRLFNYFEVINDTLLLADHFKEYILVSSRMYERYYAEPERYQYETFVYNSLAGQYTEAMRFREDLEGVSSKNDIINIYHNIKSGIIYSLDKGLTGPTLIFYKAGPENYVPYNLYYIGTPVYFGIDKGSYDRRNIRRTYDMYYVSGLDEPEPDGVWTLGKETVFSFHSMKNHVPQAFRFTATPFLAKGISAQTVEVLINDVSLDIIDVNKRGTYEVLIPYEIIYDIDIINVKLIFHTAITPNELQINEDEQLRALFLTDMIIGYD